MITFGYGSRFSAPIRALLFIALGVLMIVAKADAMQMVVKIVAAFVLAAGIVSMVVGFRQKKDGTMSLSLFNAVVNIVIAVLLFLFSGFVARFVSYLLGFVLFGFGLFQLSVLLSARKSVKMGFGAYILPAVVVLAGLTISIYPKMLGQSIGLFAGIALIVYGVSEFIAAFRIKSVLEPDEITPAPEQEENPEQQPEAKEVDFEKVDEQ